MRKLALLFAPLCAFSQPFDFIPPDFIAYLRLTEAQIQTIQRNNVSYRQSQSANIQRVNDVNREIGEETQKTAPDAAALGVRYQEIEFLCRQRETPLDDAYQQNIRVLTAEQRQLLQRLRDFSLQYRLVLAADILFLTDTSVIRPIGFPTVFNGTPYRGIGLTAVVSPVPITGVDVSSDLVAYLQLSVAQLEQLRTNLRSYQEFLTARVARLNQINQEIQSELAQENPQPIALGERYWEIEAQRRQIAAREAEVRQNNLAVLTAEQNRRLQDLPVRPDQMLLYQYAERLNLIQPLRGRPASRASGVNTIVFSPGGASSGGTLGANLNAANSIYRTCLAGPEYEVRIGPGAFSVSEE